MIPVNKPFLPPQDEYGDYIKSIWERNWLTNNGPLVNELELKLKDYLGLDHLLFTSNGTVALQIALKALDIKGEVITTPFTYVATTTSIIWEGCTPVFVDIDQDTWNIDPSKIEQAITKNTTAIAATHVFGNPCDIRAIKEIAEKYNLKVIYDAAHCFGVDHNEESILIQGDISIISFHATKLFHTVEGGAVVTKDPVLLKKMSYLRNFGHDGPWKFNGIGINGKNSEFHAGMGLCNLKYVDEILDKRKQDCSYYDKWLLNKGLTKQIIADNTNYNYAYYPIVFPDEKVTLKVLDQLEVNNIFPRRYFYPALHKLDYVSREYNLPITERVAGSILCLPLYFDLSREEIDMVTRIILRTLRYE